MITLKQTSLGIGNPAVLLMKDATGFVVGATATYPKEIKRAWSGADRREAEGQFQAQVDRMCGRVAA